MRNVEKRCHLQSVPSEKLISQQLVSSRRDGWRLSSCNKPKTIKHFQNLSTRQNGGFTHAERSTVKRKKSLQERSKARLFLRTFRGKVKEISKILMGRTSDRILLSVLRVRFSSFIF